MSPPFNERVGIADRKQLSPVAHPLDVLGLVTGRFLTGASKRMSERARGRLWHRDYGRTVTHDQNLPASLSRREPAPHAGQPRYGGTDAIGVSPAAVVPPQPEETKSRR